MTLKNGNGQFSDWVVSLGRFILYLAFSAGIMYATVRAAISDIDEIKQDIVAKSQGAEGIHKDLEERTRSLEINERGHDTELRAIKEQLDRIERKLDRGR